ncbi:MAG: manganese-dependent inorganic pyrophosphatase [Rhodobacteraceae bacterium]|nr:manganese-dependent inorganic pyrophosphatase [Paracoccaceae bacterium]
MIKIFGHKSPDTDSTGSALIWAWYQNERCGTEATAYVLGQPNKEALFVLERWGFRTPPILDDVEDGDSVIIVDTNNPNELPANIANASIVEIIDHHFLTGGLATRVPIAATLRPLACTATIMHDLMAARQTDIPADIKGLMLSCILSDTMAFRSPTTTGHDRHVAETLASDLALDIGTYADAMFAAKSDLSDCSDAELLELDSKLFTIDGLKLRISVLETTKPEQLLSRKDGILAAITQRTAGGDCDQILLFIVDILNEASTLLLPNDVVRNIARQSFDIHSDADEVSLPGIISRKKQIIPRIRV